MEILDAGSGYNPHPKATILCDLFRGPTKHRGLLTYKPVIIDERPFIVCDICYLPFRTNAFSFVYSNHVIEHTNNPTLAINELKRSGKHGYIVFPSLLWEAFFSRYMASHKWIVDSSGQKHINIKRNPIMHVLKRIGSFIWNKNCRIRFRERFFLFVGSIHNSVIRW